MDFKDSDPGGVKALLAKLKNSQTFNDAIKASSAAADGPPPNPSVSRPAPGQRKPSSVSSLLALLGPSPAAGHEHQQTATVSTVPDSTAPASHHRRDFRTMTYPQALHHLGELSGKEEFLEAITKMKDEQDRVERNLWDERTALIERHQAKVKAAKTQAEIVNPDGELSVKEASTLASMLETDLQKFYISTVLPTWDALVTKQQQALEASHVPTMFVTEVDTDRTRQQRVIQVLEGFHESKP